ncbi:hypothetical protein [Nocardia arthritidis]|uniref:Uncharacterized protein n=1 Tax=Nocardia arthritidis TaxID=228602 RepID=A0A6G9YAS0_9NOCA|nr:hypothetical protein [Nocardia arthritidis]QIS10244.1 hypothetical protein F5544_11760 [Nocardia arthritidis]
MAKKPRRRIIRRLFIRRRTAPVGGARGSDDDPGGTAGVREPRRPLPPDRPLHAASDLPRETRVIELPDARQ